MRKAKPNSSNDERLEKDERFLKRIESARKSIRAGKGRRLEDVEA